MDIRNNIRFQLEHVRKSTLAVLEQFKTRQDYLFQAGPKANNAIWIVTHLAMADDFMMKQIRPEQSRELGPEWKAAYWFGSVPNGLDDQNIATQEALDYLEDRRENVWNVFESLTDEEMEQPIDPASPFSKFPNVGYLFMFNPQHESVHFGQLTVAHRGLGKSPRI